MSGFRLGLVAATAVTLAAGVASAQQKEILIGNLVDFTGNTAAVGKFSGQGKIDAFAYINKTGGINGKMLKPDTIDYSYQAPRAIAQYKKWRDEGAVAVQGYGTNDTEAMIDFVAQDKIPYYSLSLSAHLTDPAGKGPRTKKPAPYNFFAAPSYSDGVRALVQWAAEDWKKKGGQGKAKYIHMGANHPYPNAPKEAGEDYARDQGFEVVTPIQYAMAPGDFKAQCLALKESGAHYAFLGNTSDSNVPLLRSCSTVGVTTRFLINIWGWDEAAMKAAGKAGDGVVWVVSTAAWNADVPGMKVLHEISRLSDPELKQYRPLPYMRGACGVFFMAEAMKWADKNGGITGENIKKGMYVTKDWVPYGLDGVCGPATWTADDHRGVTKVTLYQASITGATETGDIGDLIKSGAMGMKQIYAYDVPRKPEWLGW